VFHAIRNAVSKSVGDLFARVVDRLACLFSLALDKDDCQSEEGDDGGNEAKLLLHDDVSMWRRDVLSRREHDHHVRPGTECLNRPIKGHERRGILSRDRQEDGIGHLAITLESPSQRLKVSVCELG